MTDQATRLLLSSAVLCRHRRGRQSQMAVSPFHHRAFALQDRWDRGLATIPLRLVPGLGLKHWDLLRP